MNKSKAIYAPDWPVFSSMAEMAAQIETSIDLLKHARKSGCAFTARNNRCDSLAFIKWLCKLASGDGEAGSENWDRQLKEWKAKMAKLDYEEKRDLLIEFVKVERFVKDLAANCFFGELDRLSQEFPVTLKGKTEIPISKEVKRQIDLITARIKSKLSELESMGSKEEQE